jgi:creatinine amidohydrolase
MSVVHRWDRLTREEIAELAPSALLVLPIGSTEQHGPHLVTGTDSHLATVFAQRAAERARRPDSIVLAPTFAYGASDHHLAFGGTLSLASRTLELLLADILRSAASAGFRRVFVVNTHGGNTATCAVAVAEAARAHGLVAATALTTDLVDPAAIDGPRHGHAGLFETSLMLALDPETVRNDKLRPSPGGGARIRRRGLVVAEPDRWTELDGFTDDPSTASVEHGQQALTACIEALAGAFEDIAAVGA